ncbi:hypothetical protein [Roseateles amylovorans]|uniref:Uncharacterized protein n=1 Tax=Roseateles amylovorans TaxID=2978473 RepID=A0ABY6B414_9BURK|nr:hypothetical protein [Roseateles amylovorans]UXH79929.1 hypothetical protein N4261_08640 [Roseateles amylovorans]
MDEISTPFLVGLVFSVTLAIVAGMAWKGGNERRDVAFLASTAGVGGLCTVIAALA